MSIYTDQETKIQAMVALLLSGEEGIKYFKDSGSSQMTKTTMSTGLCVKKRLGGSRAQQLKFSESRLTLGILEQVG